MREWLTAQDFADEAAITPQAARLALRRALSSYLWRGHVLEVRRIFGRGGRSGLSYEVSRKSLSEALYVLGNLPVDASKMVSPRRGASDQDAIVGERLQAIAAIIAHPPGSSERREALKVATANWPERTLRRWVSDYESEGVAGLANRRPSNAGQARVVVSRTFDTAFIEAGYAPALLAKIGATVVPNIKGLWASRAEASGFTLITRFAEHLLLEMCEEHGVKLPDSAFRLSRRSIERFRHYRIVNRRKNDRKAYDDAKPRITRSWGHKPPMAVIVADVKPLDIIVMRPDGSEGWPRVIGFDDPATGRLFAYPVLCAKGEGVRQEHVIEAFLAMVQDPAWGFPRSIYTDNGSELKGFEKLRPAFELLNEAGARTIIYAKPYNAAAKPVESRFARLDRYVTCTFEGYAGKDRMTKKTQTVGRPPKPYPHSVDQFFEEFSLGVSTMNAMPYRAGEKKGLSGEDILAKHVEAGWRPVTVNALAIDAAFCKIEERKVGKFGVSLSGNHYTHPQLHGMIGRKIRIALPWRRDADPLFNSGDGWAYLQVDKALPAHWIEGAKESGRRQRSQDKSVAKLRLDAPEIDPVAISARIARSRKPLQIGSLNIPLDTGGQLSALADGQRSARQAKASVLTEEQRRRVVQDRETAALLRQDKLNAA